MKCLCINVMKYELAKRNFPMEHICSEKNPASLSCSSFSSSVEYRLPFSNDWIETCGCGFCMKIGNVEHGLASFHSWAVFRHRLQNPYIPSPVKQGINYIFYTYSKSCSLYMVLLHVCF